MEHDSLGCQVCLTKFNRVSDLKGHMRSLAHRQKMKEVFQEDVSKGSGLFPFIFFMDHRRKCDLNQPILGLSLLTLCFSPRSHIFFYLCHACEEMCSSEKISRHLSSGDHCSNYFNYTDPNALSFSWIPSINMGEILRPQATKELNERGQGTLQVLELPEQLLKELQANTYSGVMRRLSEKNKLLKLLDATKPQRTMIQTYQRDSNRKHPLLGMQHLIECIGVGQPEKRYYLCTLCNLTLATHMIIKHVVSFDHIFCYFKAWHPSTLMSKECYIDYTQDFISTIYDFTKQTEEIYGSTNNDMKQVNLDPDKFTSVNFTCYAEALKKLESITKENNGSSLITSIKPGQKLVERGREEDGEDKKREQDLNKHILNMKRTAVSKTSLYKLRCQKCSYTFNSLFKYLKHLPTGKHQQMLRKFDCEADDFHHTGCNPSLDLYSYLHDRRNQPVIGVSLVVACVSSQVQMETIYVCFACEECFSDSCVKEHFESMKHLLHTLLYHNPWRLPFGWEDHLDLEALKSMAWEEEKDGRPTHDMLKVLDIPFRIFSSLLPPSYQKVKSRLHPYTFLKHEVPQRKTYTKLDQNERFPLLGNQFLVMYDACDRWCPSTEVRILCLLCKRILSDTECYAHVFSREHVATFLNRFHPGSLNSSTDAETLLDLAKQAAQIHFRSYVQKIKLAKPIWEPCSYHKVINIIASAKRREGKGALEPTITTKQKLVSRKTLKEVDKGHVKDSSQTLEDSEKSKKKFADNDETKLKKLSVKVYPEITEKNWLKSEENVEKGANKETLSSSEDKSEAKLSETNSEMKNKDIETCQVIKKIKEEEIEESITRKPNTEVPESFQNTEYNDTETRKGTSKSSKVLTKLNNYMNKENDKKRPNMSENLQESTYPDGVAGREMEHKRQRLTFKRDSAGEEHHNIPSSGLKEVTTADKGDSGKPNYNTANDNALSNMNHQTAKLWQYIKRKDREPLIGLSVLLECICDLHDPIYLCECCCMKIPEEHIVSHVTGSDHQKMFLMELQNFPLPPGMNQKKEIRHMAALLEREQGYGEAQVIDMDEENYNNLLKQNFNSAIQTIKAHQTQQNSGCEFTSTPSLSGPQSTTTSVTLHSQQKACSIMDKIQMVKQKIDDSDVRTQPSSIAMTETTPKTTGVNTESAKDVKRIHIKVPEACDSAANIFLTGYRSSEDVYKSGTSATTLHPYFSGNNSEDKIAPNTALDPLKIAAISKIVATDPTVITPNTPMRPTSSSSTATAKVRETANKRTVTTSNANSSATHLNAANLNFGTATTRETTCKYIPTITKSAAAPPICTVTASEHTIPSSTPTGTTPSSTILNTALATKSVSKPLECRPSQTGSSVVHEVMCRTVSPSKIQNTSKNAETAGRATVASQLMVTSLATNKVAKASATCKNTNAKKLHTVKNSVEANADVAPRVHKTNPPAGSEHKNPTSEPSHTFPAKIKPRESLPKVGLNQLIAVSCDRSQQIYCQLCSVRLKRSTHMFNVDHQYNYVKLKYPEWSARPTELERKLDKTVAQLAELERDTLSEGMQVMEVTRDVYKELASLPDEQALERVKAMIRQRDLEGSSSTKDTREALTQQVTITSLCEISSPGDAVQVEQYGCEDPAATTSKSADALAQIPGAWEENRQQEKSDPEIQNTEKTLPLISLSSDLCSFTASVNTKQQNQSRPSPRAERVQKHLRCSPEPGHHNDSQALPEILAGELLESCSNLSFYLSVNLIVAEQIIGLGCVWECRGMSLKPEKSFYLCDCCEEKLSKNDICRHLTTADHQLKYLRAHRPQYQTFWMDNDIQHEHKLEILKDVVQLITKLEPYNTVDAKVILLSPSFYEFVRSASFSEALKFVQQIKTERKMRVFCPVPSTPQQKDKQPENRQSQEEPLQMGMLECETDQTCNIEASQTTDLEETLMSGGLDGAKCRRVSSPFNVDILSSQADSVVSPFPGAGTCVQSELSPASSQLQIKQAEKDSESPALASVNPETHVTPSLSVSLRDKFILTRKRRASMEAPISPCSNIAQLEVPLPAKCACSSLDSESTSTTPTMASTPQCPNDRDAGSVMCEQLVALVRETKNKINVSPRKSANISALDSSSRDILFKATEANAVGTLVPSPSTADPRDPQRSFGAQSTPGNSNQLKPRPEYCAATKNNPGQVSRPQDDQARVCQLPITPIITARQDPTKKWCIGGYKGQHHCQLTRGVQHSHNFTALSTPNPINDALAASGGHARYSQMPYVSGLQGYLSAEATAGCPTSDNPTAYNGHLYQGEASTAMGLHSDQIYLNQETASLQSFGDSLATSAAPQWISPEMLLYHHQQQQQLLMLQQQYFPWEAALTGTFPFTTPANNSQRLIGQNEYNQQHHSNTEQQKPNDTE